MNIRIEFDGGTSCNIPRLGFGNGYGSYKINDEPIHRCNFNRPMSNNAAEIETLAYAIGAIKDRGHDIKFVSLSIFGDSQIALRWAKKCLCSDALKLPKKTTPGFREAICKLRENITGFPIIFTYWQPRLKSVATFGH